MSNAKMGDTVKVHYTGTLNDGSTFDTSKGRDPIQFEIGKKQVIPGFENAVDGMAIGDTKSVEIPCAEAYGEPKPEMVFAVPRNEVPADIEPKVGQRMEVSNPQGQAFLVQVVEVTTEQVKLDANHPLAGQDLKFEIELIEIG